MWKTSMMNIWCTTQLQCVQLTMQHVDRPYKSLSTLFESKFICCVTPSWELFPTQKAATLNQPDQDGLLIMHCWPCLSCLQNHRQRLLPAKIINRSFEQVQAALGCKKALAFDITAACSGFVVGLVTAAQFLRTGMYKNIIVIGADALSRYVDWRDRGNL